MESNTAQDESQTLPIETKHLRVTISQHRNPNITEEEYHKHWTEKHSKLAGPWLARNGIIGYRQVRERGFPLYKYMKKGPRHLTNEKYHTPSSIRAQIQQLADSANWEVLDFDGYVEFMVKSVEDLVKACADPDYPERVALDEEKFIDRSRIKVTIGWEEVYVTDGRYLSSRSGA